MTRLILLILAIECFLTNPSSAKEPGQESYMIRVLACAGESAKMEVYLPQSIALSEAAATRALRRPVIGYYTLDLTEALKGKLLEPVKVSLTTDRKTLVIDQYTRDLPPTRIPVSGGTVDFDKRFGTAAQCGVFRAKE